MSLTTITINSIDYVSYATVAEADAALAVDPVRSALWSPLTDEQKGINLVAATRRLDLLPWVGSKAGGATQENAWPRSNVTYQDGTVVPDDDVPYEVEFATILVAGDIVSDATASQVEQGGSNLKRARAGSTEVEFFRPQFGPILPNRSVLALLRIFLDLTQGLGFGLSSGATGANAQSSFENRDEYARTRGFA